MSYSHTSNHNALTALFCLFWLNALRVGKSIRQGKSKCLFSNSDHLFCKMYPCFPRRNFNSMIFTYVSFLSEIRVFSFEGCSVLGCSTLLQRHVFVRSVASVLAIFDSFYSIQYKSTPGHCNVTENMTTHSFMIDWEMGIFQAKSLGLESQRERRGCNFLLKVL